MSKRHSSTQPSARDLPPKPPVELAPGLTISDSAVLVGTETIIVMSESVIHPRCRIESTYGNIFIGSRCIIQERVHLGARSHGQQLDGTVMIGDYVTIEAAAVVETGDTQIGEGSVVGIGARIGGGASIGKVSHPKHQDSLSCECMLIYFCVELHNCSTCVDPARRRDPGFDGRLRQQPPDAQRQTRHS